MKRILAIIRLQSCTTRAGRRAFVGKGWDRHGIAAGVVRAYVVTGTTWAAIRSAIASYDTATGHTMGFSTVGPDTVDYFEVYESDQSKTYNHVMPLPLGTPHASIRHLPDGPDKQAQYKAVLGGVRR